MSSRARGTESTQPLANPRLTVQHKSLLRSPPDPYPYPCRSVPCYCCPNTAPPRPFRLLTWPLCSRNWPSRPLSTGQRGPRCRGTEGTWHVLGSRGNTRVHMPRGMHPTHTSLQLTAPAWLPAFFWRGSDALEGVGCNCCKRNRMAMHRRLISVVEEAWGTGVACRFC